MSNQIKSKPINIKTDDTTPIPSTPIEINHAESKLIKPLIDILEEMSAIDIVVIDVSAHTSVTDYMIICSGRSSRHVTAIGETLLEKTKKSGQPALPSHGLESGDWVLIDLGDCIIHIMQPETRAYYNLEGLWQV